jgi:hypothetical protein
MKRLLVILFTLGSFSQAQRDTLTDFFNVLEGLCDGGLQGIIDLASNIPGVDIDTLDVEDALNVICEARHVTRRVTGIIESAEAGLDSFINEGMTEGFALLRDYGGVEADFATIQQTVQGISNLATNDLSLGSINRFIASSALASRLRAVATPSAAPAGSVTQQVDDLVRTNPVALSQEVQSSQATQEAVSKGADANGLAVEAQRMAMDAMTRGDETTLIQRVTNPTAQASGGLLGDLGTAEVTEERGARSVSTRAAVQALVDAQAAIMRQSALETTTVLTSVKELAIQQSMGTQQLANVANALYNQQITEANKWREAYEAKVTGALMTAQNNRDTIANYASLLQTMATDLGGE